MVIAALKRKGTRFAVAIVAGLLLATATEITWPAPTLLNRPKVCECTINIPDAAESHLPGSDAHPMAVRVVSVPPSASPRKDWNDRLFEWSTPALAVFTLLLWLSTAQLVMGANNTARRELRAYVAVQNARVDDLEIGKQAIVHIPIKNFGKTPAYFFTPSGTTAVEADFSSTPPVDENSRRSQHLAPGGEFTAVFPVRMSVKEYTDLASGAVALYAYGIVRYVDAFGKGHFTRWRVMIGGPTGVQTDRLASCAEGNDTDDVLRARGVLGGLLSRLYKSP